MCSLKIVRNRLRSLKSTRKITSAMKLVAASRYRKYQSLCLQRKMYTHTFFDELKKWISPEINQPSKKAKGTLLIVYTPEKGLCGGYASLVASSVDLFIHARKVDRVVYSSQKGIGLVSGMEGVFYEESEIEANFATWIEQYESIYLMRSVFRNALSYKVEHEQLWPVPAQYSEQNTVESDVNFPALQRKWLMYALILKLKFAHSESLLVEEAARMNAMEQAARNADDLIESLRRIYNRTRQDRITTELTEIISGAIALEN